MNVRKLITVGLLIGAIGILLGITPPFDPKIGQTDFRFNWTASYLMTRGENIYDVARILAIQHAETGWTQAYPLITLSPPWVALLMLPYAQFPFVRAAWLWLLTNTLGVGLSAILLWQHAMPRAAARKYLWVALFATFGFSITLTALVSGQTTVLVLASVTAFLVCEQRGRDEWAGVAVAAMFIKPQMTFVTLLLLGLYVLHTRRWRIAFGFGAVALLTIMMLSIWRLSWTGEYREALNTVNALEWESSNLGGILWVYSDWIGVKFIGLALLPLFGVLWFRFGARLPLRVLVDSSVLLSIISAPYGFSYDHVILIAPLLSMLAWITQGLLSRAEAITLISLLLIANALSYYERSQAPSEVYFFWIPLVIATLYAFSAWRATHPHASSISHPAPLGSALKQA